MRMRWFIGNPIRATVSINIIRSFSFGALVSPQSLSLSLRSSMAAAIHNHNEAGLARRFWIKFTRQTIFAMYTPFAICLASGNLKIDSFRHYIAQDVHFLRSFAQAYELAEECTDDDDAKLGLSELRKAILEELKMHDSLVQVRQFFQ